MLHFKHILYLVCFIAPLIFTGCSTFSKLTDIRDDSKTGPIASDCGSCHVVQFKEWSFSRHASAYRNSVFQEEYIAGGDEECLLCHAPMRIRNEEPMPRPYHRAGGVDCISCHFSEGKMHGPHAVSALFQPHPVEEKDDFYLGVSICAGCHGETSDEYGKVASQDSSLPTCLECHADPVQRTSSQGTNFFSNILVSFEDKIESRSHEISLDAQVIDPDLIPFRVTFLQDDSEQMEIALTNKLPHNLPTGTFGQKSVKVVVSFSHNDVDFAQVVKPIGDEVEPLAPGMTKKIRLKLPSFLQTGDTIHIKLERFGHPEDTRPPAVLTDRSMSPLFS